MKSRLIAQIFSIAMIAMLGLSSCSNKATEDQMKKLRELDQSRDGLKMDLEHAKGSLADVQGKLAAQDRDLADCQSQTAAVRAGLVNWPNIWPDSADWRVAPPPPPPAAPAKKKRH
ncbi:MAG: hypothetical protein Q8916_05475 [Bacteroidota bacterium]|nr:hypothetical protein [Bacteroidota bacterium]MDP4229840.1 hypothetical protein [Bacteroidota bacterium]MDP4236179.1 hypothetical protein [Bacteroidota bacterium]